MIERRRCRWTLSLALAATSVIAPRGVAAGDAELRSRQLFTQADALVSRGKMGEACPLFQTAHDLHSTGGTALRTADCYEKIGKPERALELYQYVVQHHDTDKVPERVKLAETRIEVLKKQLLPDPVAAPPAATETPTMLPPPAPPLPPSRVPAYVAFGVGGAGLVVGAVTGAMSLVKVRDLKTKCPSDTCPPSLKAEADSAILLGNLSTAGFIAGGAGVVTGAISLLVTKPVTQTAAGQASWRVNVGFGRVDFGGRF